MCSRRFFVMNVIRLSPRLSAVAELIPPGAHVIDVGTDHAMLPVWLIQTGRAAHVWASDLRSGPLESADRLIRETQTGDRIDLRRTDGLSGFSRSDVDTVVIAGMGGETMISILSAAPWLHDGVLLILEPQSKQDLLRRWLAENGFVIRQERLVKDSGRIYPILTAESGAEPEYTEAEYHTGCWERICSDPLFGDYLETLRKRAAAAAPYDENAKLLLSALDKMKERLEYDNG